MKDLVFASVLIAFGASACADIIENIDLNIIDDPGNPSDGLRYLDMTYSGGLTLADALLAATAVYPNARVATANEFNDLFAASDLVLDGATQPSMAFQSGTNIDISTGANYNQSLRDLLGLTDPPNNTLIFTAPDGNNGLGTTRDAIWFFPSRVVIANDVATAGHSDYGWLLVSEPTAVPEPKSIICLSLVGVAAFGFQWFKKRRQNNSVATE